MTSRLVLEALDVAGPLRWRWRLSDEHGAFVADHDVVLSDDDAEYAGFADLYEWLRWRADPQDRLADEAALVARVGEWVGQRVWGPVGERLAERAPVTVRVLVPAGAEWLLARPLELGHVAGRPLALQDVALVFEPAGAEAGEKAPVGQRLRMLGVFSLPVGLSALALRQERYALAQLIERVAAVHGRALQLRVLQYGVTRARLREIFEEGEGWDVVHFSGHGLPRGLVLETEEGRQDPVAPDELVKLLWPARQRVKLVVLSSCSSAAQVAADTLRLLGVDVSAHRSAADATVEDAREAAPSGEAREGDGVEAGALPALAHDVARRLRCAVLAMRYPVVDEFAIRLSDQLYTALLGKGQPLTRALQLALPKAARDPLDPGTPAVSVATPALFGPAAADLRLAAPAGPPLAFDEDRARKLAGLPEQPPRFVGRTGPMARASAALAPAGGRTGVLFHGMAGAGKTACALELAYTLQESFRSLVWYEAPPQGADITGALARLAVLLERKLPGLDLVGRIEDRKALEAFLPELATFWRANRVLLVLDNCESLLTEAGAWRDPRWGSVVEALTAGAGLSRTVLTSRWVPQGLPGAVLVEPIHALSSDEAVLLARELPNLGALLAGRGPLGAEDGRRVVARTLAAVQGHPELLRLADADAADPAALRRRLDEAEQAWGEQAAPPVLFDADRAQRPEGEYLRVLDAWARQVAGELSPPAAVLFAFLCCLEPADRMAGVVEANWGDLWRRLERPGEPPELAPLLDEVAARALVEVEPPAGDAGGGAVLRLHPAVAESGRDRAGEAFRAATDRELASFWAAISRRARDREAGPTVVQAGLRAAPYLLRLREWMTAAGVLERAIFRDQSPTTIALAMPYLERVASAARGTDDDLAARGLLAGALSRTDPKRAEPLLREVIDRAAGAGDFSTASAAAGDLTNLLRAAGRLDDALTNADRMIGFTRQAGHGRWTQLAGEAQRLQILVRKGQHREVLERVPVLRLEMEDLPHERAENDTVDPWNVRETILDTGCTAAVAVGEWEQALEFLDAVATSERARGAPAWEVTSTRFNAYSPLLRLGRTDEARDLLHACQGVFEAEGDVAALGKVFSARADLEDELRHRDEAVELERRALRYCYSSNDPDAVAVSHHNLAGYLRRAGRPAAEALDHRLAAAVLYRLTGSGQLPSTLAALAGDLAAAGEGAVPASFDELRERVEQVDGMRFSDMVGRLLPAGTDHDEFLASLVDQSQALRDIQDHVQRWEQRIVPVIAAAARGHAQASAALEPFLDELTAREDSARLAAALRGVVAGERDRERLRDGLDPIDRAILDRVLDALPDPA